MRRGPVLVVVVAGLLVAGMAVSEVGGPAAGSPTTGSAAVGEVAASRPVDAATLVCPLTRVAPRRTGNYITAATLGSTAGAARDGLVQQRALDDAPAPDTSSSTSATPATPATSPSPAEARPSPSTSAAAASSRPSPSASASTSPSADPSASPTSLLPGPGTAVMGLDRQTVPDGTTEIDATGALAPGLNAEQFTRGEAGVDRGLSSTTCTPPSTDQWFTAASTVVGASARLVLANPADADAVVDITFLGADGQAAPSAGQGLTVPARSRLRVPLENLSPDQQWLAVHVTTRTGRVAAAVQQYRGSEDEPQGVDWLPRVEAPARDSTIAGIPGGMSHYTLLLANPSQDQVAVGVQAATTDGEFAPVGLDQVEVPAQSVVAVDATKALQGGPASLVLAAGSPVVAAVAMTSTRGGSRLAEIAYAGQVLPLDGPGVLSDVRDLVSTTDSLLLTAVGGDVSASLTPLQVVGQDPPPGPRTVQVPAGRTVELVLGDLLGPGGYLPVTISRSGGAGHLYAAQSLVEEGARGLLITGHGVPPLVTVVQLPGVVDDIAVSRP